MFALCHAVATADGGPVGGAGAHSAGISRQKWLNLTIHEEQCRLAIRVHCIRLTNKGRVLAATIIMECTTVAAATRSNPPTYRLQAPRPPRTAECRSCASQNWIPHAGQ
jgi:hypothetical protein